MSTSFNTITEQVAQALRDGLRQGRWQGTIPGRNRLATELGVNHKTVKAALAILENEGQLESRGPGRERRITDKASFAPSALRVMMLPYEKNDLKTPLFMEIIHRLGSAGHLADFATKTLHDLGMDPKRVARFVGKTEADAWLVVAGTGDVLDWFATQPNPTFSLFGRSAGTPMASATPRKAEAMLELTDRLVEFGHRRIVMLAREERRKPTPGVLERLFLEHLESHGIETGPYNLPDWSDDADGLRMKLDALFRHTPPTALIIDDEIIFLSVVQQLARMGIVAPRDVSLACSDASPAFEWCRPKVTHIAWNHAAVINRVVNWTNRLARGKHDRRTSVTRAKLMLGGTIGPVP